MNRDAAIKDLTAHLANVRRRSARASEFYHHWTNDLASASTIQHRHLATREANHWMEEAARLEAETVEIARELESLTA